MGTLRKMKRVAKNIHRAAGGTKAFMLVIWFVVFLTLVSITGAFYLLVTGTSIFDPTRSSLIIYTIVGIISVPMTILFILYIAKKREAGKEKAGKDSMIAPSLKCAQGYLYFTDWDLERFRKEITENMGMDEWDFAEDADKNLTDLLFRIHGFSIDHRFESADLVHVLTDELKAVGIFIYQDLTKGKYDVVTDPRTYERTSNVIIQDIIHEVKFETPFDLAGELNRLIVPLGFRLLMNELDGDTYEFLLVRNELARRMLIDHKLKVH